MIISTQSIRLNNSLAAVGINRADFERVQFLNVFQSICECDCIKLSPRVTVISPVSIAVNVIVFTP